MNNKGFFSKYCAFFSLIFRYVLVIAGGSWEMSVALITSVLLFDIFRPGYNKPVITSDLLDGGETRPLAPILF